MKRLIAAFLMLLIISGYTLAGAAKKEKPHLLWDIPFRLEGKEAVRQFAERTGIQFDAKRNLFDAGRITYVSSADKSISIAEMPIEEIQISTDFNEEKNIYEYTVAVINLKKIEEPLPFSVSDDMAFLEYFVLWTDYMFLPKGMESFQEAQRALTAKYGEPDYFAFRPGGIRSPTYVIDDVSKLLDAKYWLSEISDGPQVVAAWGNVYLHGEFTVYLMATLPSAVWKTTIVYPYTEHDSGATLRFAPAQIELDF